jgi:conjugative relaxase-like TrwC/TraI family protein
MTAESIGAAKGGGYARYLESKTVEPELGAYYLTPEGEPQQPAGRWLASPDTLTQLGIEGQAIAGADFIALMEGRHPRSGRWLRPEGAGGGRGGGIDVTFSAPKSVSVEWALGDQETRRGIEKAHSAAVTETLAYIRETVPTVRRRYGGAVVEECGRDLIAAEYRHTTARRVVVGEMPDPQLHSHVVITAAVRDDGRFVAVASRPIFRSARDAGAYYRSALAQQLIAQGFRIDAATGRHGRYFEIAGRPRALLDAVRSPRPRSGFVRSGGGRRSEVSCASSSARTAGARRWCTAGISTGRGSRPRRAWTTPEENRRRWRGKRKTSSLQVCSRIA